MKWKKVSEHPLPKPKSGKKYLCRFLFTLSDGFQSESILLLEQPDSCGDEIIEWCEFNPDEIESADNGIVENTKAIHEIYNPEPKIDLPSDIKENLKSVYGKMLDNDSKITDRILEAVNKREQINWEQRRYEIAKDVLSGVVASYSKLRYNGVLFDIKDDTKTSIEYANELIAELKRGRE